MSELDPKIMDQPPRNEGRPTGRLAFWTGIVLCLVTVPLVIIQYSLKQLIEPWHIPILTTLGALSVFVAVTQQRTLVRSIAFVLFLALAGFQWYFLVVLARLPTYEGPAQAGTKIPPFQTVRSDDKPFTEKDLQDGKPSVILFFRGEWWLICMIELGQLEEKWEEFHKRNVRVIVVSLEDSATALKTQAMYPRLLVLSDAKRGLSEKLEVIHPHSAPDGGDTAAPTTILVDGTGTVRWTFRPARFLSRLTPSRVLAAIDEHLPKG